MKTMVNIYQFVPLPASNDKAFARTVVDEVLPLVDLAPTRGGQIASQTLLMHEDGRYQWWLAYESSGGSWVEETIRPARAKLAALGVIYAEERWDLLATATMTGWGEGMLLPLGMHSSYQGFVRAYHVSPDRNRKIDSAALEQAVNEAFFAEPLPPVKSRAGHIRSHILLKANETGSRNDDRYMFIVLRWIKLDVLTQWGSNIDEMATIRGVEDFHIVQHVTATEAHATS